MTVHFRPLALAAALAASFLTAEPAPAGSLEVAPVKITLPAKGGPAVLYVANRGKEPIFVQLEGFAWRQKDGGDVLEEARDLAISPPMAKLAPGARQTVRLLVAPDAAAGAERSFRVIVSELPDPATARAQTVRLLLQFSIPIFAGDPPKAPTVAWRLEQKGDGLHVFARNEGTAHVKFSGLRAVAKSGRFAPLESQGPNYVLAGATREWRVPGRTAPKGDKLTIVGRDERSGSDIRATVIVAP
jgi:fimbrial chaperone protein